MGHTYVRTGKGVWLGDSGVFDSLWQAPPVVEASTIGAGQVTAHSPKNLSAKFQYENSQKANIDKGNPT